MMAEASSEDLESSVEALQKTISDYKVHIEQISALHKETARCFEDIQNLINEENDQNPGLLPALQIPQFDFSKRIPSVLFIGSHNCGKSTLINVFLRENRLLPMKETPCTSRIVRVVYSPDKYVRLMDADMNEVEKKSFAKGGKVVERFVVLEGSSREDSEMLQHLVEIGIDHKLLECGIELIDSPGRHENKALDRVVEEFIDKGVVPLIVYIVDGNYQLRDKDKATIRELQDKFPNVSLMFVCSKVDCDKMAHKYDKDDEKGEEDEKGEDELYELAQEKKEKLFQQLTRAHFLLSTSMQDCPLFHGVSAKNVKSARRSNLQNKETDAFNRFQHCILQRLEDALRRDSKRVLSELLSAQEMILNSVVNTRKSLSMTANLLPEICDQALKTELSIFQANLKLGIKSDEVKSTIRHDLEELASAILDEGESYINPERNTIQKEFQTMQQSIGLDPELLQEIRIEELLLMEFLSNLKGAILDRTFNVLKYSIQGVIREALSQAVGELIKLTQCDLITHPFIGHLVQRIFGVSTEAEQDANGFIKLHVVLDGLLETVDSAVNSALRQEISGPLSNFDVTKVGRNPRPRDPLWRRKVVQTLLSKLDYNHVAESVIKACDESLLKLHQLFRNTVESYRVLNSVLEKSRLSSIIQILRSDYVPHVAELAVRGHGLQYVIERGPPKLGDQVRSTAHSQLYSCYSPAWCGGRESCLVKVITKSAVGTDVWNQTMIDCMHSKYIAEQLGECCRYHLQLNGWFFQSSGQFCLVMEPAKEDLLVALRRGMSKERRMGVAVDTAKALQAMHNIGYVYQDLKPQNVMLTEDGTAKLNLCKPEKPFEETELGIPFHISPEMFVDHAKNQSKTSYDIYAFGSLLWVLSEGSGRVRPGAYSKCTDIDAMKIAVRDGKIRPEQRREMPESLWKLMCRCWDEKDLKIETVLTQLLEDESTGA